MPSEQHYYDVLDDSLRLPLRKALQLLGRGLFQLPFVLRLLARQRRQTGLRRRWEQQGLHVPPFLIISITDNCNLRCPGCYNQVQTGTGSPGLKTSRMRALFEEAGELGVAFILLAGGEPLLRPDILEAAADCPEITFAVFTNGLLFDAETLPLVLRARNIVPVISLEGGPEETDRRRGEGVYDQVRTVCGQLKGQFWGTSLTVTSSNLAAVSGEPFVRELLGWGCRLFFFVEYIPISPGTEALVPDMAQRTALNARVKDYWSRLPGIFVSFPGDEEKFGGCLSSGRGFVHISAAGDVEPCPFSPFSDSSIRGASLQQALTSPLLAKIRSRRDLLSETSGGCALWQERAWVASLVKENNPKK